MLASQDLLPEEAYKYILKLLRFNSSIWLFEPCYKSSLLGFDLENIGYVIHMTIC